MFGNGALRVGWRISNGLPFSTGHFVQRALEQTTGLKMRFTGGGNVDYFSGAGIARSRFWTRIFDLEDAKTANFYAIALY